LPGPVRLWELLFELAASGRPGCRSYRYRGNDRSPPLRGGAGTAVDFGVEQLGYPHADEDQKR